MPDVRNGRSGRQHGIILQIMTYKFGSKIEDAENRLNEFLELVRRYDEANGTDPVPDQVKKACIISNTPEPLKTHLQLNVVKLGKFNALRVATEDYLRSRRIFKTTSAGNTHDEDSMEVDAVSRKGKGKEKSGKGFLGPGSEKKCYSTHGSRPQGEWDRVAELMMIKFGESGHPVFRSTSPLSRGMLTSKGGGKLSKHFCADGETIETFSHNYFC